MQQHISASSPNILLISVTDRDAHIEGYIQQFLYTYRYFCKPEDLLQFLTDTFRRVAG